MASNWIDLGDGGYASWKAPVDTAGSLPSVGNTVGDARAAEDTGVIYVWTGASWDTAVGGVGTVTSVGLAAPAILSVSGSPVTGAGTLTLSLATQTANTVFAGPSSGGAAAPTFRALVADDIPTTTGTANTIAVFDNVGDLVSSPTLSIDTNTFGVVQSITEQPNNGTGLQVNSLNISFDPLQNSPNESYNIINSNIQLDINDSGFTMGTAGQAVMGHNIGYTHQGTGNVGTLGGTSVNFQLGNGTDPISVNGISYAYGFGQAAALVTMDGPIQGYGFQPSFNVAAVMGSNSYVQAFCDTASVSCAMSQSYTSFNGTPNILSIPNNNNYTGVNINPSITTLVGNAQMNGVAVGGSIGTINSGNYQGVSVNPNVTLNNGSVTGLNVSVTNVTNYAGVVSDLTIQDLTFTFNTPGDNNSYTIEYVDDTTAGNESFTILGNAITGHIESGVSTATQVKAAADANISFSGSITTTISGTASDPQVTQAATNFANGINPGTSKAAQFDGDVQINGALSFTGGLSIGALQSFATEVVPSGAGVHSIDTLITAPTVAASATITGTDLLAINTAMLLSIGNNATVTSSFLGYAALGLPAVLSMGTGSTIDLVEGAVFAISLDGGATGGTVDEVKLCRSIAIPNGVTTVTELKGYSFDLPFGDPGTTTWGFYSTPATAHNFMAGDLKIGSGADTPANSSVGLELESTVKAFLPSRMTTTQRDALTAINGMVLYNSTVDKLQVYAAGSWVDLH